MAELLATTKAKPTVLAVDNGGTNTRLRLQHADKYWELNYKTPSDYQTAVAKLGQKATGLRRWAGGQPIAAVGFAIAGRVSTDRIVQAGELQANGWCGHPFSEDVAASLAIAPEQVVLMGDCAAAAKAQQVVNGRQGGPRSGYVETISTGFGGALFEPAGIMDDEPGHEFYRSGALCGCGNNGCAEAHVSGSGIERKFGVPAGQIDPDTRSAVLHDLANVHVQLVDRLWRLGKQPEALYLFGSVALKMPGVISTITDRFAAAEQEAGLQMPAVRTASHGDNSGLIGALYAAQELLVV